MILLGTFGVFAICFLLGSVPWGVVVSRLFFHTDVRHYGSGNIGTTNSFRALGKAGGVAVFVLDFGKGLASGFVGLALANLVGETGGSAAGGGAAEAAGSAATGGAAGGLGATGTAEVDGVSVVLGIAGAHEIVQLFVAVAFLGCVWGHIFSPWLGFRGGKGIAVAVGCLFVTFGPVGAVVELAIFAVLVVATRRVSVGSIAAAAACPLIALFFFWGAWVPWLLVTVGALTVIWAHRSNIERLMNGTEARIGAKGDS